MHCQVPPEDQAEWEAAKTHIRQAARAEIDAVLNRISALEAVDYQAFWAPCMLDPFIAICQTVVYNDEATDTSI